MLNLSLALPVSYDLKNPARGLIEDTAPDFGITIPKYNGQEAFLQRGRGGRGLSPINVSSATITVPQQVDDVWQARIAQQAQHDIVWTVQLPPRPKTTYWEHLVSHGGMLWAILDAYHMRKPQMFAGHTADWLEPQGRMRFYQPGPWYIRLHPLPDVEQFMKHILAHELQHVEDHAWLAQEIIGPLDDWHAKNAGTTFTAEERADLFGAVLAGYAETSERIIRYWQQAIVDSGDLYHESLEGAHPKMEVINISRKDAVSPGYVDITVEPVVLLRDTGFDLDDPLPHCHHTNQQLFKLATGKLGGNEPKLQYIPAQKYKPRVVRYK